MRNLQTKLGKAYTESLLKQRDKECFKSSRNNPGKTNAKVNAQAKVFRVGGRLLIAVGIGSEVYTIVTAEEPLNEIPRSAGRLGGAFAGGRVGLQGGARFGPWGAGLGTLGGAIAGSMLGEEAIDTIMRDGIELGVPERPDNVPEDGWGYPGF